jgi:phage terminase large subunit-like protein
MNETEQIEPEIAAEGAAPTMTLEEARRRWGWVRPRRGGAPSALSEEQWLCAMIESWSGATDEECALRWRVHPRTFAMQRRKRGLRAEDRMAPVTPQPWRGRAAPPPPEPAGPSPAAVVRLTRAEERLEKAAAAAEIEAAEEALPAAPTLRAAQRPPAGDGSGGGGWRTWLFLGGRGAGKTLAGAAWLAEQARTCRRLALVGPALLDVREVMVEGPSGLRGLGAAFGPAGGLPRWEASRRRLLFPNGAVAYAFSAEDPESLRGPQFEAAWADEVCAWPRPEETLALLRMGLRLGPAPRLVLTTTPKPRPFLRRLLAEEGLVKSTGSAAENAEWLAPGFVAGLRALYGGTRLERQEVDGAVLEAEGGLFRAEDLARARALGEAPRPERFERLVVAVDPPAGVGGSACGIVVVGRTADRRAWVLEDATVQGMTPGGWADRVAEAAERAAALGPVEVVAEANQGGEMVRQVLTGAGLKRPLRLVRAVLGKRERAEPVALLYEQGRVAHAAGLSALEDQLALLGAEDEVRRGESPDRADALVWALTDLLVRPPSPGPRIRVL